MVDSKQYILSINAQLKGQTAVISGLKQMGGEVQKFKKTVDLSGKGTQNFSDIIEKAGMRALIVAPIWMILRSAMMGVLAVMSKIVSDNMKFEDSMADVRTMLEGTTKEIESQFMTVKQTILDTAINSRASLSDLTDAFRFLKSANLDFQQTMAGFPVVVSLMNTFKLSAMEASRAVAGMANTAGASLGENLTLVEQFAKIGDILAYTYVKQDVMIGELIQSYAKFAPFLTMTSNSFLEIVTTLGLLNTLMNRGSRAGTEMGRGLLTIITKSDKLAEIFDIIYDRTKPINFLEILTKIQEKIGTTGKLTSDQAKNLSTIFGKIGLKAFGLLLPNLDKLQEAIADAEKNSSKYLKRLEEIKMSTTEAQLGRMSNILSVLGNDFISGVYGVGDYAEALKFLNDTLIEIRPNLEGLGIGIGWLGETLGRSIATFSMFFEFLGAIADSSKGLREIEDAWNMIFNVPSIRGLGSYIDSWLQAKNLASQTAEEAKALKQLEKDASIQKQEYVTNLKEEINLLKIIGINEYASALYKYQQVKNTDDMKLKEEALLDVVKARAQLNEDIQKKQISFIKEYAKSNAERRKEMLEIVELGKKTPEQLASMIESGGLSSDFILDNLKYFNKSQTDAIEKALLKKYDIRLPVDTLESLLSNEDYISKITNAWSDSMKDINTDIVEDFAQKLSRRLSEMQFNIQKEITPITTENQAKEEAYLRNIVERESLRYSNEIRLKVDVNLGGSIASESGKPEALKITTAIEKEIADKLGNNDYFKRIILRDVGEYGKVSSEAGGSY